MSYIKNQKTKKLLNMFMFIGCILIITIILISFLGTLALFCMIFEIV